MGAIRYETTQRVDAAPSDAYDFMIVHQPENHPRWEPAVVSLTHDGPLAKGMRGTLTRRNLGMLSRAPIEFLDVQPGRSARYLVRTFAGDIDVTIAFEPVGTRTDVRFTVVVTLTRGWRLLTPVFRRVFARVSAHINARLAELLARPPG